MTHRNTRPKRGKLARQTFCRFFRVSGIPNQELIRAHYQQF